jgi:hypothetical protein
MQHYVNQLLDMLQEAHSNRPGPRYLELSEEMECLRDVIDVDMPLEEDEQTMESIFGVPQYYFPPEDRLSDEQIKQLIKGILDLWHVFHYEEDFCRGEFTEREQYTKLVEHWKKTHLLFRGTNVTRHIEMYDYEQYWNEEDQCYLSEEAYFAKHNLNTQPYELSNDDTLLY